MKNCNLSFHHNGERTLFHSRAERPERCIVLFALGKTTGDPEEEAVRQPTFEWLQNMPLLIIPNEEETVEAAGENEPE